MGEGSSYRTLDLTQAEREAIGRAEQARLEAACRAHDVAVHTWLGGAVRQRVPIAMALPLDAASAAPAGVRRVALVSAETDVRKLIALLDAAAKALGRNVELGLLLDEQLRSVSLRRCATRDGG